MKNIKFTLFSLIAGILLAVPALGLMPSSVSAELKDGLCKGADLSLEEANNQTCENQRKNTNPEDRLNNLIRAFINIFSVIVGIIAVIMIIIGGFKFITSAGDTGKITSAKHTVIYALVGLIIVALAQFIVRFVLSKI